MELRFQPMELVFRGVELVFQGMELVFRGAELEFRGKVEVVFVSEGLYLNKSKCYFAIG